MFNQGFGDLIASCKPTALGREPKVRSHVALALGLLSQARLTHTMHFYHELLVGFKSTHLSLVFDKECIGSNGLG